MPRLAPHSPSWCSLSLVVASYAMAGCSLSDLEYLRNGADDGATSASAATTTSGATGSGGAGGADACPGVNLEDDDANCGRCGHDCLYSTCEAGTCRPIVLAKDVAGPQDIALDGEHLYFSAFAEIAEDGGIYRTSKEEEAVTRITPARRARSLVVGDDDVYFSGDDRLLSVAKGGGDATPVFADDTLLARAIALDPDDVSTLFFAEYDEDATPRRVHRAARDGDGTPALIATAARCESLFVSGPSLFIGGTKLLEMAKNGVNGDAEELATLGSRTARRIAIDDTHVYWTEYFAAAISAAPRAGEAIDPVSTGDDAVGVGDLAVDDTHVYWTVGADGTHEGWVLSARKDGSEPKPFTLWHSPDARCLDIALDEDSVYFVVEETNTGAGDGKVMKLAK
jgi:hypothetical protein